MLREKPQYHQKEHQPITTNLPRGATILEDNVIMPSFLDQLTNDIKLKCPLLTNIVNSLAVGKSTEKNVGKKDCDFKFKAAIQTVMALDDIRSERSKSSFSTIFGLLLIAHEA